MAAGAAGVLDEPLDCANWNTVRTMFPSSSSGEADFGRLASALVRVALGEESAGEVNRTAAAR